MPQRTANVEIRSLDLPETKLVFSVFVLLLWEQKISTALGCENKRGFCSVLGFRLCSSSGELWARAWAGGIAPPPLSQLGRKAAGLSSTFGGLHFFEAFCEHL